MSFGIIHSDVNWEWERIREELRVFVYSWRFLLTLGRSFHEEKNKRG